MANQKENKQLQRRKNLERKKFLLGNAFMALSKKMKGEFSSETLQAFLESKAKSARDRKLVEELKKKLPVNFSWRMESSEPALEAQIAALEVQIISLKKQLEKDAFSQKKDTSFILEENSTLKSQIRDLKTNFNKLDIYTDSNSKKINNLETIVLWAVLLSIPHIIISLYMFFMFRVIPTN